jgi:hypothetical protein
MDPAPCPQRHCAWARGDHALVAEEEILTLNPSSTRPLLHQLPIGIGPAYSVRYTSPKLAPEVYAAVRSQVRNVWVSGKFSDAIDE